MKALQYRKSIPRYALLKLLGPRIRSLYTSPFSPVGMRDVSPPKLPNQHWVRIAPRLSGICGSDLATITAKGSPYLAPVTSMPFVLGHELIGTITEVGSEVQRVREGDRVVLHPALGCEVRGIHPQCEPCSTGRDALCRNVARGNISPGIQTGYCRDTGGGFSQSLVAHQSQVYLVPKEIDDRAGVLIEPFACAIHAVYHVQTAEDQTILVTGCGAIGLLTIAALRATGCKARIVAVAKYDHQAQHAQTLGANEVIAARGSVKTRYRDWAKKLDAEVLDPEFGKPMVVGGADVVFDCVASSQSIDDGIRFTKSGGTFVLVGMPAIPRGIDWTPLWFKELTIHASYAYGRESGSSLGEDTFDIAIELMKTWGQRLAILVSSPFDLSQHRQAFSNALNAGRTKSVKTVFAIQHG